MAANLYSSGLACATTFLESIKRAFLFPKSIFREIFCAHVTPRKTFRSVNIGMISGQPCVFAARNNAQISQFIVFCCVSAIKRWCYSLIARHPFRVFRNGPFQECFASHANFNSLIGRLQTHPRMKCVPSSLGPTFRGTFIGAIT